MARIYIYHHPADEDIARQLISQLAKMGRTATTDPAKLSRGRRHCRIVLITDNSTTDEASTFHAAVEALAHESLLFVRVNSQAPLPFGFQDFTPVDLVLTPDGPSNLDELTTRIKAILTRRPADPRAAMWKPFLLASAASGLIWIVRGLWSALTRLLAWLRGMLRPLAYVLVALLILVALFKLFGCNITPCQDDTSPPKPSAACRKLTVELNETGPDLANLAQSIRQVDEVIALQGRIDALQNQIDGGYKLAERYCKGRPCIGLRKPVNRRYSAYVRAYGRHAYTEYKRPAPDGSDAFLPFYDISLDTLRDWLRELRAVYGQLDLVEVGPDGTNSRSAGTCANRFGSLTDSGSEAQDRTLPATDLICLYARHVDARAQADNWRNIRLRKDQSPESICGRMRRQIRDLAAWIKALEAQQSACERRGESDCDGVQSNIDQWQDQLATLEADKAVLTERLPAGDPNRQKAELEKRQNELREARLALAEQATQACTVEYEGACGPVRTTLRPNVPPASSTPPQSPQPPARKRSFAAENTMRLCEGPPKPVPARKSAATATPAPEPDNPPDAADSGPDQAELPDRDTGTFPWIVLRLILIAALLLLAAALLRYFWRLRTRQTYVVELTTKKKKRKRLKGFFHTILSFARADLPRVDPVAYEMERMRLRVWIDRPGNYVGEEGAPMMAAAIKDSKVFTLMASEAAYAAQNVYRELHVARYFNKDVVTIRLDDTPVSQRYSAHVNDRCPLIMPDTEDRELRSLLSRLYGGLLGRRL